MVRRTQLQPGDVVIVGADVEAYYSGYAGNPTQWLRKGQTARVINPDVPPVRGNRHCFVLVEFDGATYGSVEHPYTTWRASLYPEQIARKA